MGPATFPGGEHANLEISGLKSTDVFLIKRSISKGGQEINDNKLPLDSKLETTAMWERHNTGSNWKGLTLPPVQSRIWAATYCSRRTFG